MNDLAFVARIVDLLESSRLRVWLAGGWAEELRGLRPPCAHSDVDFLYPGRDFGRVDRFLAETPAAREWTGKRTQRTRAFELDGVLVELLLVQRDDRGWFSELAQGRYRWPDDVFLAGSRIPVVSEAALLGYRAAHAVAARAA